MPYCMYLRKSRKDVEASGDDADVLLRHKTILLDLARKLQIPITKIYQEVVSGDTIEDRPVMQELLYDVERGLWDGVLVVEVERLARGDTIDQGIVARSFKLSRTKIITPVKTYDPDNEWDEEYFEFGLFMSRREYKTINRRLQSGRLSAVKEGRFVGSVPSYGHVKRKIVGGKGYALDLHPDEAPATKLMYDLIDSGMGTTNVAHRLDELGIPPRKGQHWSGASVREIIKNPINMGKARWNWRKTVKSLQNGEVKKSRPKAKEGDYILVDALCPPIVTEEQWWRVVSKISSNHIPRAKSGATLKNPLAGIVKCGACGRSMVRRAYSSGYPDTLLCPNNHCNNVGSDLHVVEQRVINCLSDWLESYKVDLNSTDAAVSESAAESRKNLLKKLQNDRKKLEAQLDSMYDLLEQKLYTYEVFQRRSETISKKLEENKTAVENLQNDIASADTERKMREDMIPKIQHVLDAYSRTDDAASKNSLLKSIISEAVYTKAKNCRWTGDVNDFELIVVPKIR